MAATAPSNNNETEKIKDMLKELQEISPMDSFAPSVILESELEQTVKKFKPNSSCKKCYGRGYKGIQKQTEAEVKEEKEKIYLLCNCVKNKILKADKDGK